MSLPRYSEYRDSGVRWLGKVPAHWAVIRYKQVFKERDERSSDGAETLLSVSAYTGVSPRSEIINDGEHLTRAESLEGYKVCYPDDLVMNIMLAWNRGLGVTRYHGIVSPAYSVFEIVNGTEPRFLDYMVRSDRSILYYKAFSSGVIDSRLRLYPETFGSLFCALPPKNEQAAIADFLDCETAKIDALIAAQEKLLALLAEKRQATISHAVTRGLNPNATMKDSGSPWLGEVPTHWKVTQLKYVVRTGTAVTYGIVQAGPHFEGGVPYIKTSDMAGKSLPLDGYALTSPEIDAAYARSRVASGDVVVAIRATIGKCLPVPPELAGANLTQGTAKVSPGEEMVAAFLLAFLRSDSAQVFFDAMAKGATFKEITLDALRRTPMLAPPKSEQREIADFVDRMTSQFDRLESDARTAIDLFKERRSALIAAAVTGKIDVRSFAADAVVA